MKRVLIPTAAVLAMTLAAPSFASQFQSDRGYDDLRSYDVAPDHGAKVENTSAKGKSSKKEKDAFKDFNRKFGSPHPNFESGRR